MCSDTVEALIGAIFIDNNYNMSRIMDCIANMFSQKIIAMVKKFRVQSPPLSSDPKKVNERFRAVIPGK